MLKLTQYGLLVLVVVGAGYFGYRYWQVKNIAAQYDEAAEIASSSLSKSGKVYTMRFESVIQQPSDKVWQALRQPERMSELQPDAFKKSVLEKDEGAKKTVTYELGLLSLPVQTLQAEITYDDAAKTAHVLTSKGMQNIDAKYTVVPAGEKTRLTFAGTATDMVSVPIPQSVIEGALKELFVVQVRAIKKASGETGPEKFVAAVDKAKTGSVCEGDAAAQKLKQVTVTIAKTNAPAPAVGGAAEYRNAGADGYDRGYVVDGVLVKETFTASTRCTKAKAVTPGGFQVEVQSILLSPESLESWVRAINWQALGSLPATSEEKQVLAVMPLELAGWDEIHPVDAPPLPMALAHRAYQQALF